MEAGGPPQCVCQREYDHGQDGEGHVAEPTSAAWNHRYVVERGSSISCDEEYEEGPHHEAGPDEYSQKEQAPHRNTADVCAGAVAEHCTGDVAAIELTDWQEIEGGDEDA